MATSSCGDPTKRDARAMGALAACLGSTGAVWPLGAYGDANGDADPVEAKEREPSQLVLIVAVLAAVVSLGATVVFEVLELATHLTA
jgi:hypothetical protein